MANIITNILTINGSDEQVAKVREFIKGANGDPISFQSIIPMPEDLYEAPPVEVEQWPFPIPAWEFWRMKNWSAKCEPEPVEDELVNSFNRIIFDTRDATPIAAIRHLSQAFPSVIFEIVFACEFAGDFCGEYIFKGGTMIKKVLHDAWPDDPVPVDEQMEYYFRTHEYDRKNWRKDEDGEWVYIYEDEDEE